MRGDNSPHCEWWQEFSVCEGGDHTPPKRARTLNLAKTTHWYLIIELPRCGVQPCNCENGAGGDADPDFSKIPYTSWCPARSG